jgi:hypothetical protein
MSWNDGVSKELNDYFESLGKKSEMAVEALQEQIDIEAEEIRKELEATAPKGATFRLLNSPTKIRLTARKEWYGYSVTFEGKNRHGEPYQKLANILNYGTSHTQVLSIQGTRFISRAIRNLRGMDARIAERFNKKAKR